MTPNIFDATSLKEAVRQRPDYPSLTIQTREALGCYYEGMALRRLINPYPAEDSDKFTWRRERMLEMNDNYVREVCSLYLEGVFRTKQAERKTGNAKLDEYLADKYEEWFMQECAPFSLFLDEVFVVCTVPKAKGPIYSLADKNELQGLPYPAIYFPQFCANLGYGELGELEWCCFYYGDVPELTEGLPTPSGATDASNKEVLYEIYTRDLRAVFNQDGQIKEVVEHGYGFLPVVRIQYGADHSANDPIRTGHSFMRSIVKINLGGLAAKGALQDFQYYALFPKFVAGERTLENVVEDGSGAATPIRHAGDGAGGNKAEIPPFYLRAPTEEFEALERIAYERIPNAAYRAARLRDRETNKTGKMTSGVSKMFDMVPELGVLKAIAKFLQRFDLAVVKMLTLLADGNPDAVTVKYPSAFDTKSLSETMAELIEFGDAMTKNSMPPSSDGTFELASRAYRGMLPDMPDEFYAGIDKQIRDALNAPVVASPDPGLVSDEPTVKQEPSLSAA